MAGIRNSKAAPHSRAAAPALFALLAAWSAAAVFYFYRHGWLLYYGDAEAHLNIARRIVDSRTPGPGEIGSVWLPLPHVLMAPLARVDWLWRTGLAGAIPSAAAFVIAGVFLFLAVRRIFGTAAPAAAAAALLALNPNVLYLQSTAMTEPLFLASAMALLYFTVVYGQTQSAWALAAAGLATSAGTLVRYDGWFLIPFVCLFVLAASERQRWRRAALYGALASLGPIAWLAHCWYYTGDPLDFYRGPYSAKAIQHGAYYPGKDNWALAWLQLRTAARLCAGAPVLWMGAAGALAALWRRAIWPVLFLLLAPAFYLWSMHSSGGTPIFVPSLWPHGYYNTRYGLCFLPLALLGAAALVSLAPRRLQAAAAVAAILAGAWPWLGPPHPEQWITWKESQVNSDGRRAWSQQAADFLAPRYRPGQGILTTFGDVTGIYRRMGLPLRETLSSDNWPTGPAAIGRPDLFLTEQWTVAQGGDEAQKAMERAARAGVHYERVRTIMVKDAPVLEIYRRDRSATWLQHQQAFPSASTWSPPPSRSTATASSATSGWSGALRSAPARSSAP